MDASVVYTPLHDDRFISKLFLGGGGREVTYLRLEIVHKGEKYPLINTSRMQKIEIVG